MVRRGVRIRAIQGGLLGTTNMEPASSLAGRLKTLERTVAANSAATNRIERQVRYRSN